MVSRGPADVLCGIWSVDCFVCVQAREVLQEESNVQPVVCCILVLTLFRYRG